MSLQTRLEALISAIGADVKAINARSYPWLEQILTTAYTNSTVTATDVHPGFTPVANTRYLVDVLASVSAAAATTGVQVGLTGPTTGITRSAVKIISASAAATDLITHTALNSFQAAVAGLTTPSLVSLQAIIETAGNPGAGNIRLQAKSEVAGSAITLYPGSSMRWRTI